MHNITATISSNLKHTQYINVPAVTQTHNNSSNLNNLETSTIEQVQSDILKITPLGAGSEVGRSCILISFKDKTIMLDAGVHPGYTGLSALPFFDFVDPSEVSAVLISHFHLDHAASLPYFTEKTDFDGKVYMTHPTKAIYKWFLSDYVRVSTSSVDDMLYDEQDLSNSYDKIQGIDYHQEVMIEGGIRFTSYNAGHVLGAAMFLIEIAGVKILYTGDYSREEDRHLMAAERPPNVIPDVLICESTYGVQSHEPRIEREHRFTKKVHEIVERGGRCLLPVFALGRAQELLLILDEYWQENKQLHSIPIYFASSLAKKCMSVYQTYINMMNDNIKQKLVSKSNPFIFKHISNLRNAESFDDVGPCVMIASPGMLQNGLSRELFEKWCSDKKNGILICGYSVEGTLAKTILNEPSEITSMAGVKLPLKMSVDYISFSAHVDYTQNSEFIGEVLVHGETNNMNRLKAALKSKYPDPDDEDQEPTEIEPQAEDTEENIKEIIDSTTVIEPEENIKAEKDNNDDNKQEIISNTNSNISKEYKCKIYTPKNCETVELNFSSVITCTALYKYAKANEPIEQKTSNDNDLKQVLLVKKDFKYYALDKEDVPKLTSLSVNKMHMRLVVPFHYSYSLLLETLVRIFGASNLKLINKKEQTNTLSNENITTNDNSIDIENDKEKEYVCGICLFDVVDIWDLTYKSLQFPNVVLEWNASYSNDLIADSVCLAINELALTPFNVKCKYIFYTKFIILDAIDALGDQDFIDEGIQISEYKDERNDDQLNKEKNDILKYTADLELIVEKNKSVNYRNRIENALEILKSQFYKVELENNMNNIKYSNIIKVYFNTEHFIKIDIISLDTIDDSKNRDTEKDPENTQNINDENKEDTVNIEFESEITIEMNRYLEMLKNRLNIILGRIAEMFPL